VLIEAMILADVHGLDPKRFKDLSASKHVGTLLGIGAAASMSGVEQISKKEPID